DPSPTMARGRFVTNPPPISWCGTTPPSAINDIEPPPPRAPWACRLSPTRLTCLISLISKSIPIVSAIELMARMKTLMMSMMPLIAPSTMLSTLFQIALALSLILFQTSTTLSFSSRNFGMNFSTMKLMSGFQIWSLIQFHTLVILSLIFCQTSRTLSHKDWNHGNKVLAMKPQTASQIGLLIPLHSHEMAPWILSQTAWTTPHRVLKIGTRTPVMTFQIASQIGLMMTFQANEMAL